MPRQSRLYRVGQHAPHAAAHIEQMRILVQMNTAKEVFQDEIWRGRGLMSAEVRTDGVIPAAIVRTSGKRAAARYKIARLILPQQFFFCSCYQGFCRYTISISCRPSSMMAWS